MRHPHPFAAAVVERLDSQGVSRGGLCSDMGHRAAWFSDTIRRVERGAAIDRSVLELVEALAIDADDRRELIMLAVDR